MSDGTTTLTFLDPNTYEVVRTVEVRDKKRSVSPLNELEYVQGRIYANIWLTDNIAIIDPNSGTLQGMIDLTGLKARHPGGDVLNGIAYDAKSERLFVTGKYWSELYEIEIIPR
jgi:glutamine cyclotransferase